MPDPTYSQEEYDQHLEERKALIDAGRESARTFDQAVLAFGSAIFAASIAFLKDVAPKPLPFTVKWLATAWVCFLLGLLFVLLSFMFSHRACMQEIVIGEFLLKHPKKHPPVNRFSILTDRSNILCIVFLFSGLVSWIAFAIENLVYRR